MGADDQYRPEPAEWQTIGLAGVKAARAILANPPQPDDEPVEVELDLGS